MSQSLAQMYIHLVFGTKFRKPWLNTELRPRLFEYFGGTLKAYESPALIINGTADHVHLLLRLSKNYALAKVVEELKKQSSKWIKQVDPKLINFSWQGGYGAFSVSSRHVDIVRRYIENQEEHHRKRTYQEEVVKFMDAFNMTDYDEEYFWS